MEIWFHRSFNLYKMSQCEDINYTEDGVPVRKLVVSNINEKISFHDLQYFFQKFGSVKQLVHSSKITFVTFNNPYNAACALRLHNELKHHQFGLNFEVTSSPSWEQPDAYSFLGINKNDPQHAILDLNDYCLQQILLFLPLSDRIRFARTYVRIREIYQDMSKSLHKTVYMRELDKLTVWEKREFFKTSLWIEACQYHSQEFDFDDVDLLESIESLKLVNCGFPDIHSVYIIVLITNMSHSKLKDLFIKIVENPSRIFKTTLDNLYKMMHFDDLEEVYRHSNLKYLTVEKGPGGDLDIDCNKIRNLPALRTLHLKGTKIIGELNQLNKFSTLEELELSSPSFDNLGVLNLIHDHPNLKTLRLYDCPNVTNELIRDLATDLRKKKIAIGSSYRPLPIKINVRGTTQIIKSCLNDPDIIVIELDDD